MLGGLTLQVNEPMIRKSNQCELQRKNQLRAKFDFVGTPIRFIQRLRKRQDKHGDTDN